jgi:hypothetical protein
LASGCFCRRVTSYARFCTFYRGTLHAFRSRCAFHTGFAGRCAFHTLCCGGCFVYWSLTLIEGLVRCAAFRSFASRFASALFLSVHVTSRLLGRCFLRNRLLVFVLVALGEGSALTEGCHFVLDYTAKIRL